jgi:peroxiredoxin (alkyl hydroperoxide reductase subunit C)
MVFFSYSLDFTFLCGTEIAVFDEAHKSFDNTVTQVIGISVDSVYSHLT